MTYWLLNAVFLALVVALVIAVMVRQRSPQWRPIAITMAILLVMTAVFDNVMISVGLVGYSADAISGAFIGVAPLEDFAYAVAAVVALPCLWSLLGSRRKDTNA
ncbi:lycopene cyclase domain-containing protein [Salinibacterium sp. UTAS2018]|uniref:lycopene cyclase domain-containing protein n=1 Tax=Salinibacterium sp. UTAS2018 TaxID=2508880 RepID=UPI0010096339|nr:lycopene cyclase domain-containing protein [Salinibacterium sp. UTAS2018]QAV70554.1 lycopene cyclase domain-containing protein [Salinibacterium sp. UTAS2018]